MSTHPNPPGRPSDEELAAVRPVFDRIAEGRGAEGARGCPTRRSSGCARPGCGGAVPVELGVPRFAHSARRAADRAAEADSNLTQALRAQFAFVEDRLTSRTQTRSPLAGRRWRARARRNASSERGRTCGAPRRQPWPNTMAAAAQRRQVLQHRHALRRHILAPRSAPRPASGSACGARRRAGRAAPRRLRRDRPAAHRQRQHDLHRCRGGPRGAHGGRGYGVPGRLRAAVLLAALAGSRGAPRATPRTAFSFPRTRVRARSYKGYY